jgi:hypothetical protein
MGEREGFACVACGQGGGVADVCACDSQWDGGRQVLCVVRVCVGGLCRCICVYTHADVHTDAQT